MIAATGAPSAFLQLGDDPGRPAHDGRVLKEQISAWGTADFRAPAAPEAIAAALIG